ncbi:hypothetical protein VCRA2133E348_210064 [Vibrio crassostreae]|nr:hypothetical protein VCRA2119O48_200066 [Vibrio crassostreae]CAK2771179.1 hypothetical protein VCRA2133E348_210064 [Vibrio crassostreae]CAK3221025.1 hypothetical protein VCRA213O314_190035 [Vibrio crassostreae]CAK3839568.1 hypothetical protein VCRA212O16_210067 [Vibrio crassostreae]
MIEEGDKLVFTGDVIKIKQLNGLHGLEVFAKTCELLKSNLSEVIVSPESVLIGRTLKK